MTKGQKTQIITLLASLAIAGLVLAILDGLADQRAHSLFHATDNKSNLTNRTQSYQSSPATAFVHISPSAHLYPSNSNAPLSSLTDLLTHPDPQVRGLAASTLATYSNLAKPSVPALLNALADTNTLVRESVIAALRQIAPEAITNGPTQ